jgi:hypothetical protein
VWQEDTIESSVSIWWMPECQEGWMVLSDQRAGTCCVSGSAFRMRVEATFQDSTRRGWDLETNRVKDDAHVERVLQALFFAMWWVSYGAASCLHHGQRDHVDRHNRREKGMFRLGCLWLLDILRRITNSASLTRCFPFHTMAPGSRFALRFSMCQGERHCGSVHQSERFSPHSR